MAEKKAVVVGEVNGRQLYVSPNGLRFTSKGKVAEAGHVLSALDKGTARRVRKACRKAGYTGHAAARRSSVPF